MTELEQLKQENALLRELVKAKDELIAELKARKPEKEIIREVREIVHPARPIPYPWIPATPYWWESHEPYRVTCGDDTSGTIAIGETITVGTTDPNGLGAWTTVKPTCGPVYVYQSDGESATAMRSDSVTARQFRQAMIRASAGVA